MYVSRPLLCLCVYINSKIFRCFGPYFLSDLNQVTRHVFWGFFGFQFVCVCVCVCVCEWSVDKLHKQHMEKPHHRKFCPRFQFCKPQGCVNVKSVKNNTWSVGGTAVILKIVELPLCTADLTWTEMVPDSLEAVSYPHTRTHLENCVAAQSQSGAGCPGKNTVPRHQSCRHQISIVTVLIIL